MLRLGPHFIVPGTSTASFLVGALNAVQAPRERKHWFAAYLVERDRLRGVTNGADDDACAGFDAARALIRKHGRRAAKRAIVRLSRYERALDRWARDRGDHIAGGAAKRLAVAYRPGGPS